MIAKLLRELVELEDGYYSLADPEVAIAAKARELLKAVAAKTLELRRPSALPGAEPAAWHPPRRADGG